MKAKAAVPVLNGKGEETGEFTASWAASNQALNLVGKELGMFIERSERGKPGDYSHLSDAEVDAKIQTLDAIEKAQDAARLEHKTDTAPG
jgi:hypothetical protein